MIGALDPLALTPTSPQQWLCLVLVAFALGFSKAGVPSMGTAVMPFAIVFFHPKEFMGVVAPLLILGDTLATLYYYKHIPFKLLASTLPLIASGMALGALILHKIEADETLFKIIGVILLTLVAIRLFRAQTTIHRALKNRLFGRLLVFAGSVMTTLSHSGGPFIAVHYLNQDLKKVSFLGAYAMTFLFMNIAKIPIYAYQGIIHQDTLLHSLYIAPFILAGSLTGKKISQSIPEKLFQHIISALVLIAGIRLLLR